MPHIAAFRGLRYDPGHVGSLDGVVAPPSDAIDDSSQSELYKQHPTNVVRLVRNRKELGDEDGANSERAGRFFRNWQRERVLQREPDPAIYVYHQLFDHGGRRHTRRGFVSLNRLSKGDDAVCSVEDSPAAEVEEQLRLLRSCKANLSPVFAIYADDEDMVQEILEDAIINVAPIEATDSLDVTHRIWPITDIRIINDVATAIAPRRTYIASGQATYRAALEYQRELGVEEADTNHNANFVMTMCVSAYDPGLAMFDLEDVLALCERGELVTSSQPKFEPRLLSGLVFNTHDS